MPHLCQTTRTVRCTLPDNLKRRQPEDPAKINVNEPWELTYWSNALGVTPERLKQLVALHGTSTAKVKAALGK